jgi:hypothetical protein
MTSQSYEQQQKFIVQLFIEDESGFDQKQKRDSTYIQYIDLIRQYISIFPILYLIELTFNLMYKVICFEKVSKGLLQILEIILHILYNFTIDVQINLNIDATVI